jgi:chromosome segregation ATPase
MKKTLTLVKDWGTLVAFCTLIVIGMRIRDDIKELKKVAIETQKFQKLQGERNAQESIVYDWALQKLMGIEIHELDEEESDNP